MPNKTQEYLNLAQQTAKELTRYWENWTDYLTTASRLYKYNYADQLMIYAQRPDATACASFDLWNDRMNRYVRHGSKCRTVLRRRKEHHRKNAVPIDDDNLGFFHCGRVLGCFFVIEVFGTNAQPASARCRSNGVWAQPNKHFEFGFEKSDSKIASWYQLALLAIETLPSISPSTNTTIWKG